MNIFVKEHNFNRNDFIARYVLKICQQNYRMKMSCVIVDFTCPIVSDEHKRYADPKNCSKFYECHQGKKSSYACQPGFLFDAVREICDFESDVKCGKCSYQYSLIQRWNRYSECRRIHRYQPKNVPIYLSNVCKNTISKVIVYEPKNLHYWVQKICKNLRKNHLRSFWEISRSYFSQIIVYTVGPKYWMKLLCFQSK